MTLWNWERLRNAVEYMGMSGPATNGSEPFVTMDDSTVAITTDRDIVAAREHGRTLVSRLGFSPTETTLVITAISELARNIVLYAKRGEIVLRALEDGATKGILVIARDHGPGIPDVEQALGGGYSTCGGMGLGLHGTRRLMDEFEIASAAGTGTTVAVKLWSRRSRLL
jgi:serine/threonine-protein kinase RsbT